MLVLSRKLNETIVIDGNIRITVVGIRGNQIRLGIEAPDRVKVFREELCDGAGAAPAAGPAASDATVASEDSGTAPRRPPSAAGNRPLTGRTARRGPSPGTIPLAMPH